MLRRDELTNSNSCLNKAFDSEYIFVLLERDLAAPDTIRDWVARRIKLGKNKLEDPQIQEALQAAIIMERSQKNS